MSTELGASIARLGGVSVVMQATNIIVLLLTTVVLSRQMGIAAFGEYVLVLAVVSLSTILTTFGLPTFLTREIAAGFSAGVDSTGTFDPRRLVRNALGTSVVLFLGIAILIVAVQARWPALMPSPVGVPALAVILGRTVLEICAGVLAGLGRIRQSQMALLLLLNGPFLLLLSSASALSTGAITVDRAFELQALGVWAGALLSMLWVSHGLRPHPFLPPLRTSFWGHSLRACVPLALANGLTSLQQNLVFLVLGGHLSAADVGIYRIAERISGLSQFLRAALQNILQPIVSRSWRDSMLPSMAGQLRKLSLINTAFNLVLLGVFALAGPTLIRLVFGTEAVPAWRPLLLLFAGYCIAAVFGFNGMLLSMTSHAWRLFRILAFTLSVLCLLLFLLTLVLGIFGAALATVIYTVLTAILLWRAAYGCTGVNIALVGRMIG